MQEVLDPIDLARNRPLLIPGLFHPLRYLAYSLATHQLVPFVSAGNEPFGDTLGSARSLDLIERGVVGVKKPFHSISIVG